VTGYADKSCECGSPFPTLLPVQGRLTDLFYFKNPQGGYERFPPNIFNAWLFYMHNLRQYQIIQTERNALTFIYVSPDNARDIEPKLKEALKSALAQKGLHNHVMLHFKRVDFIARDERSRKYKTIISMEPPGDLEPT
jgi:phenylacetate-coenzyme A ligase PaaK-like adenylate-forming protein